MFDALKQKKLDKQYSLLVKKPIPKHIGIILDGNGRWAKQQGLPRIMGHAQGIKRIKKIIPEVKKLGVEVLTLFVFSTENWNRPSKEVDFLMDEAKKNYEKMIDSVTNLGYNVRVIGEEIKNNLELNNKINELNFLGSKGEKFTVVFAFNYGSKKEIVKATQNICQKVVNKELEIKDIDEAIIENSLYTKGLPPVDLMIRTSGEERISNFLLWQIAYAELYFPKIYWPDFDTKALYTAIENYQKRNRRFGKIGEQDD